MARKMKAAEGEARGEVDKETGKTVLTNVQARSARIQSGFEEIYALRREKEELEEKHLKDVKDRLKKAKRDLKADTDIDSKDLDIAFKLYERNRIRELMEDDDSDRVHDNLKEIFSALIPGGQLDFLPALAA
jgi:membrane-associated HD superfamily phosphohydrolase